MLRNPLHQHVSPLAWLLCEPRAPVVKHLQVSTYQKSSPPTSSCRSFGKRRHDLQLSHWTHTLLCLCCLSVLGCSITGGPACCCRLTCVLGGSVNIASAHTHSDSPVHRLYRPRVVTISTSALAVQTAAEARGLGPCDKLRQILAPRGTWLGHSSRCQLSCKVGECTYRTQGVPIRDKLRFINNETQAKATQQQPLKITI